MKSARLLPFACFAVLSMPTAALALPVPSYVALPPGYGLGATVYARYDRVELTVPDPSRPAGATQRIKPAGRLWRVNVTGDGRAFQVPLWRPVLEHAGWQIVATTTQTIVARHDGPSGPTWLHFSGAGRFVVVETATAAPLTLALPAAAPAEPEALTNGHDVPYLPPLPGMTALASRGGAEFEEMTGPLTGGPFFVGPPVIRVDYHGPTELSGFEIQTVYLAALTAAGWTINFSHEGGLTVAHYTQHGRDIWAKVWGANGDLHLSVVDVGANAAAARLRAAIERDGHVALYGIYFDVDRDALRPDSEATLQQILALVRAVPTLRLEVQGHTDNTGTAARNQTLSQARAASVRTWLIGHGVAAARLTAAGYADRSPVADNRSDSGRARNRRVELKRLR